MQHTDDLKYFQSKFQAHIEDSREYKQYRRRSPFDDYTWNGKLEASIDVAPMRAIHLTDESLDRLIREQRYLHDLESDAEYGKKIVRMLREDERVRDSNPAVAKAYRNYITLLELARK